MPTIYIDMDGVVADFNTAARKILRATPDDEASAYKNGRWPEERWRKLSSVKNLYRILPKMRYADLMMLKAYQFRDQLGWDVRMLTAIPKNNNVPDCIQDKIEWMQEFFPGIRVHFGPYSQDKQRHCQPGDILVDDRTDNCEQWRAVGGRAVKVGADYAQAMAELDQLFREIKDKGN